MMFVMRSSDGAQLQVPRNVSAQAMTA